MDVSLETVDTSEAITVSEGWSRFIVKDFAWPPVGHDQQRLG